MPNSPTRQWRSYDDVEIGARIEGFGRTISDAEITMITALTTGFHQPLHTNAEWVRANTAFTGVILPGPIIVSYAIGLLSATLVYSTITVAFLGLDKVRAKGPVYGGDTISAAATVTSRRLTSNGENGIIDMDIEVTKQDGSVVMTFVYTLMVRAKAAA
jgi:acyl dehydratase